MNVIKGEAYKIAIVIKNGTELITPNNCDGIRVAFANQIETYPDGDITYSNGEWLFPLSQDMSYRIKGTESTYQVQVKIGTDVFSSTKQKVRVDETMFREVW